jgi:hypothetical protein
MPDAAAAAVNGDLQSLRAECDRFFRAKGFSDTTGCSIDVEGIWAKVRAKRQSGADAAFSQERLD